MRKTRLINIAAAAAACLFLLSSCAWLDAPVGWITGDQPASSPDTSGTPGTQADDTESQPESGTALPPAATSGTADTGSATTEPSDPPDTTAPFFISLTRNVTLKKGSTFDIHKYISYVDDYDSDVELTVTGSVDTGTVGTYNISFELRDDAGNTTSSTMSINILETLPPSTPYTPAPTKSFAEFRNTYKKADTMVGIDVSRYQTTVDFQKVAAAGCEFVIIRLGGFSGELFTDSYYKDNIKNAKQAGLKVGVYWYSEENGPDAVRQNAEYLYSVLGGEKLDFPIFFDWEDFGRFENYKMSLRDFNDMFLAFKEEAEARGYKASLYNSKYYLELVWSEKVKKDGIWLAQYYTEPTYTGPFFLWQQGVALIDGISGDVDVDVFYPGKLS
ncbi:MAG: DUF5011 domain-containing protein [Clostridiales bacterium]|nr:DUF5011 domain-containing protein [Clostridiales bacterium]